jgi:hypothetical protein
MRTILFVMLMSTVAIGCGKKKDDAAGGGGDKKSEGSAPGDLPALTAEPDPGKITPAETAPAEAVKFRMLAKRGKGGWPTADAYNHGTKPVGFLAIYGYAYDKDGKQLARTKVPLSWNGKIEPGEKTSFSIDLGAADVPVTAAATTFQFCYTSIKFVGDADQTKAGECPDQRPKK